MLEFRELTLGDRDKVNTALHSSLFMGCEYSFANNLAWRRLDDSLIAFYKEFYICCGFGSGSPRFVFPAGKGDLRELIGEMKRFCESRGCPLVIRAVNKESLAALTELFGGQFTAEYERESCDYIYNAADLIGLRGKKYHAKRNHLARFREQGCVYSPLTESDFDDAIVFITQTYNGRADFSDSSLVAEQYAVNTFLSHFCTLGLSGGIIRKDGEVKAVAIGEALRADTFCVHTEKADTSVPGIYAGINNCFASDAMASFRYINREEDMGLDGLRKSKLSYNPAFLLDKYIVTFN